MPTHSLEGVVTDKDSGEFLAGTTVNVTGPSVDVATLTNECGRYVIDGLPAADYTVAFYYGNVTMRVHMHVSSTQTVHLDEPLQVTAPGATPIHIIGRPRCGTAPPPPAAPPPAPTAVRQHASSGIDGVVTDATTREPLVGATVTATVPGSNEWSALSDENGYYALPDVPAGTLTVTVFFGDTYDVVTDVPVEAGHATVVDDVLQQSPGGTQTMTRWTRRQPPPRP
jgi:hypothetical protein